MANRSKKDLGGSSDPSRGSNQLATVPLADADLKDGLRVMVHNRHYNSSLIRDEGTDEEFHDYSGLGNELSTLHRHTLVAQGRLWKSTFAECNVTDRGAA